MATPFVYDLLPLAKYEATDEIEGRSFAIGGRTRWTLKLQVGALASGGSVTVKVRAAPIDDDDYFEDLVSFGAVSSAGTTTKTHGSDFTVQPYHKYLRVERAASAQTGDAVYGVTGTAPFLDPALPTDTDLLSKQLREWDDGLTRTVEQAERDVRALMLDSDRDLAALGVLDVDLTVEDAYAELRQTIAEQADWLYERYRLLYVDRSDGARKTAREMDDVKPDVVDRLRKLRPVTATVWRGR